MANRRCCSLHSNSWSFDSLISSHHLSTPYHLALARNTSFWTHQIMFPSPTKLPFPVTPLRFVYVQGTLRFQFLFCRGLSSSNPWFCFFSTERVVWDGIRTSVTVDHITAAFWSLWVHGYLVTLPLEQCNSLCGFMAKALSDSRSDYCLG